ncbi:hypothetical protein D3C77_547850 [compost metagenome]
MALVFGQFRKFPRRHYNAVGFIQRNIAAIITLHDLRLNIGARKIGSRIQMGQKADHRYILHRVARERSHDIAIVI